MTKKILAVLTALIVLFSMSVSTGQVSAGGETKYVTAKILNVRSGTGTDHKIVTTVKKDQVVTVSAASGSWSKITANNKVGWVSNKYLATKKPVVVKPTTQVTKVASAKAQTKYVTATVLNLRSGAGTNYKVVTTVKKGQAVSVSGVSGYWNKITVGRKTGWVSGKYLASASIPASKTPVNPATSLKTVAGNKQLVLVTTNGYTSTVADIKTFEKDSAGKWVQKMSVPGYVGKKGIGKGSEGDAKTPAGKYTITTTFGQRGNPGTKMPFKQITSDDVWVDDSNSKLYNTWQSRSKTKGQWKSAESMKHRLYTNGFVIDYNTARVPGAGSAIFFHVGNSYTLGCVATAESNVVSVMKWLDPTKKPVIIMTATQDLNKY